MAAEDFVPYQPSRIQQNVLSFLMIPSGILSILGSSYIIRTIRRDKKSSPYRRIMLVLSACDLVATVGYMLQPFLGPADSAYAYAMTVGNDATCTFTGILNQLSFSALWYAGALSFYFVSTVRYGVSEFQFTNKYERWIHVIIISFHVITSVIGAIGGVFNQRRINPGCWVADPPDHACSGLNCHTELVAYCFAGFPLFGVLLFVLICNGLLYAHVKRTIVEGERKAMEAEKRLQMYQKQQQQESRQQDSINVQPTNARGDVLQSLDKQWKRVRQVRRQAALYVMAYFATFIWPAIINVLNGRSFYMKYEDSGKIYFPLLVLQSLLLPLQGFFNAMVFFRPKFMSTRNKYPQQSRSWCVKKSIYGQRVKPDIAKLIEEDLHDIDDPSLMNMSVGEADDDHSIDAVEESESYFSSGRQMLLPSGRSSR